MGSLHELRRAMIMQSELARIRLQIGLDLEFRRT